MTAHKWQNAIISYQALLLSLVSIFAIVSTAPLVTVIPVVAQPTANLPSSVKITSDRFVDYSISDGMLSIGTFHNSFAITGDPKSLSSSKDLIISGVNDDINRSAIIGYIRAENVTSANMTGAGMPNPFVSPQAVTEEIKSEITNAIDSSTKENWKLVEIHCTFDTVLSDWRCDVHPLFK